MRLNEKKVRIMTIAELRRKIDLLDKNIVKLLNQRAKLALEIGNYKKGKSDKAYVPAREKRVLANVRKTNAGPLGKAAFYAIYREIMSSTLALESDPRVAYLGPAATFTHEAARSRFGASVKMIDCDTIADVFGAVQKRQADYGVVPIENSTEGAVTYTLDEFLDTPLKICAEIYLQISHHLLSKGSKRQVKRILSNPQVFGQCRNWLHKEMPHAELIPVTSTARAAAMASKMKASAAIAGLLTAEMYGLKIIASDIHDMIGNTTRFLVIAEKYGEATGNDKSSILFSVKHKAGALYSALESFKRYGINMTKIESRPSCLKAWEYFFFVDIEGHVEDEKVRKALKDFHSHCTLLNILGSYPSAQDMQA